MWWSNQKSELEEWEYCIKYQNIRILDIILFISNKNPPVYKEYVIYFIVFAFGEGVTVIYLLENMKLYVSNIVESYEDTIIGHL